MTTLVEFLQARIAEDEAATQRTLDDYVDAGAWGLTRVLDECQAKRAILAIERWATYGDEPNVMGQVLAALAHPYRLHPELDPSWRVNGNE